VNWLAFALSPEARATELEYQLLLARDLKLIQPKDYEKLSAQTVGIKRMLTVLIQKRRRSDSFALHVERGIPR
jgi:four helix bundle protein